MVQTTKKSVTKKKVAKKKTTKKSVTKNTARRRPVAGGSKAAKDATIKPNPRNAENGGNKTAGSDCLVLSSVLMINGAKNLHKSLNDLLINENMISVDASSVEMIDTAMIQLLIAFNEKVKSHKKVLEWISPSGEFMKRADALNVSSKLGLLNANEQ